MAHPRLLLPLLACAVGQTVSPSLRQTNARHHRNLQASASNGTTTAGSTCDVCPGSGTGHTGTTIEIVNNCGYTLDVQTDAGMYGSCRWDGLKVPSCLRGLGPGAAAAVALVDDGGTYAFYVGPFGNSTRYEVSTWHDDAGNLVDSWDVSYNAGFDIGMTVILPPGGPVPRLVCTNANSPAAYQRGADGCQVQPCMSPTWTGPQGPHELNLCNRPGDVDTPGPCGCSPCPGIACTPGAQDGACTTSGGDLYCQVAGADCPMACNAQPSLSGSAECPTECLAEDSPVPDDPGPDEPDVGTTRAAPATSTSVAAGPLPSAGQTCTGAIRWRTHPSRCLDVSAGWTAVGTNLQIWKCYDNHRNMQFIIPLDGTGAIRWATHANRCLVARSGGSVNGHNVELGDCGDEGANAAWITPGLAGGLIRWVAQPDKCLDVADGSTENGGNLQLWDCWDGSPNQQFDFDDACTHTFGPCAGEVRWASQNKCFDVNAGRTHNGNNVQIWSCNPGYANMQFEVPEDGTGVIRWSAHPNKCLDVSGGRTENGNRVQIWDCNTGHPNMQFIVPGHEGGLIHWAAHPDKCLTVENEEAVNGRGIRIWACSEALSFSTPGTCGGVPPATSFLR